jgi:hypothetical protein
MAMELDEVIRLTKQALENVNHDKRVHTEFRFTVEQVKQLLEWLEDYKELRAVNTELKRLLMFAMDSMQVMSHADGCVACSQCRYETPIGEDENGDYINSPHCDKSDCFEWKYRDKAMKLLGGAENAEN